MLRRLAHYVGEYKKYFIITPILVIVETIIELLMPRMMAAIVDVAIPSGDLNYTVRMGFIMLLVALASMTLGVLSARFSTRAAMGFGANLRRGQFNRVQEFSFGDIDRFSSASLVTRMTNDTNQLQQFVNMGLRLMVRTPVMIIVAVIMCLTINVKLCAIFLVVVPLVALGIFAIMRVCNKLFGALQAKIDNVNNTVQENLVAIRVVKAFVRSGYEKTKFQKVNDELMDTGFQVGGRMVLMMPLLMLGMCGATVAAYYFGGGMVIGGNMLVGDLSSFNNYIFQILMSVMMIGMMMLQFSRATACARRIDEVLTHEPDIRDGEAAQTVALPESKGKVEFKGVHFKYNADDTGDDVLEDINLTVEPGEFVAIVGGTGTGKSSLVNLIPRFYDVSGGQVLLDGMDVRDYPIEELRSRIGMVLQSNVLFSGTIRENLKWGNPNATEEEVIQAAKDAQAYDFVMSFPEGFDTYMEQGGVNVSGGQKQRLCIARAMLRKPSVLILDDSTSAVDSATEAAIRESFHQNLADTSVIIIAQRISSVQYADKIIVLDDGQIKGVGTHDELMANNAIYQEIYASQQEGVSENG
ncbi:MAG: ABC transporter ATP-binding protein [Oscillospiraceae bacterium]|nr:ABC transporter ATP-binding protein [Oscillospiraceae bacterium]